MSTSRPSPKNCSIQSEATVQRRSWPSNQLRFAFEEACGQSFKVIPTEAVGTRKPNFWYSQSMSANRLTLVLCGNVEM